MLLSLRSLRHYKIRALDGPAGISGDYFFDQSSWIARYVVVSNRELLASLKKVVPLETAETGTDTRRRELTVQLTKHQIASSPDLDTSKPMSRRMERTLYTHYGYPAYWTAQYSSPSESRSREPNLNKASSVDSLTEGDESFIRSLNEVIGYQIQSSDDCFGYIQDLIVETSTWSVRYMVLDVKKWLPSKRVLIAPDWVLNFDWGKNQVLINLQKDSILKAPEFDPNRPVNRELETRLYDYYGRPKYWEDENNSIHFGKNFMP